LLERLNDLVRGQKLSRLRCIAVPPRDLG
jgi:hypothetical protein